MDAKKLKSASKIFNEINDIEKEIQTINKYALSIANDEAEVDLSLAISDLKKKEEKEVVSFDEDGSLNSPFTIRIDTSMFGYGCRPSEKKESKDKYIQKISNNAALNILGILLCEKQFQKDFLINKIKKIGIEI